MSATIIRLADRSSTADRPPSDRKRAAEIRRRLVAIENHRGSMSARQTGETPDPIFKAIDVHCEAVACYHTALGDDEASDRAMAHEGEVLRELMSRSPNSLDGILALLNHLGQPEFLIYGREGTGETILQEVMEIAEEKGQAFPLTLEETIRDVIIAICSRPPRRGRRRK
jgi:hypothetical protein